MVTIHFIDGSATRLRSGTDGALCEDCGQQGRVTVTHDWPGGAERFPALSFALCLRCLGSMLAYSLPATESVATSIESVQTGYRFRRPHDMTVREAFAAVLGGAPVSTPMANSVLTALGV